MKLLIIFDIVKLLYSSSVPISASNQISIVPRIIHNEVYSKQYNEDCVACGDFICVTPKK